MAIRKILLPLIGTSSGESALTTALIAALLWRAHVAALHVSMDIRDIAPLAGEGLSGAMIEDMMAATEKESSDRTTAIHAMFDRFAARHAVKLAEPAYGTGIATASFTIMTGREEELVAQQSRLADLTVVPHPESGEDLSSSDALHAVLFDSGRPVLIAPHRAPDTLARRICCAWNGSAESAAAVRSALPWMRQAEAVQLLSAPGYQRRGPEAVELAGYLALHGVSAEVATFGPVERSVGAGLLKAAAAYGCDLLVMGAYSHSRLRQLILGGVTRHVLEFSNLPVMMSR
jgi:nucleotide-binding universal stress UspA family protein